MQPIPGQVVSCAQPSPGRAVPRAAEAGAPLLISLPDGLSVSGVTTWALRLAGALAARGRAVMLVAHEEPRGQMGLAAEVPRGVTVARMAGVPPLREARGNLDPFLAGYRDAVCRLGERSDRPVVLCPTLLGDGFGIAAELAREIAGRVRIVGWQHADIPYERHVLAHYEPLISGFAGVSRRIVDRLRSRLPHRASDVVYVPNGVPMPTAHRRREPPAGRPLRLIYTGRLEHDQKRILGLIEMSQELLRRGVPHVLRLVGDGPAAAEVRRAVGSLPIELGGALAPDRVADELNESDVFVLASRWEGLSVAMLEAMAAGCVPVVTRVESGASEAICDSLNGVLVDAPADADLQAVGAAMAGGIQRALAVGLERLSGAAAGTIREGFSLEAHASAAAGVIDAAAEAPSGQQRWPADKPVAFSTPEHAGTVPPDAEARLRAVLGRLAGRTVVIHGAGQHTAALVGAMAASAARIAAICDDDRARWNSSVHGWRVISPEQAGGTGASDVVLSSFLHEDDLWSRRAVYERQGLRVWRLYASADL